MRWRRLRAVAAIVWIILLLPGCRAADSVGVMFRAHYEDFQKQYSLLQGEMRQYDPAVQEDCETIAGRMEDNDHLILMKYALQAAVERMDTRKERELALECKRVMNRMETISFYTENSGSLSDGQKQELAEAYAAVFG